MARDGRRDFVALLGKGFRSFRRDGLIREEVGKLGSKKGGLMMIYGLYPRVPLENVEALMNAMEKCATHYS